MEQWQGRDLTMVSCDIMEVQRDDAFPDGQSKIHADDQFAASDKEKRIKSNWEEMKSSDVDSIENLKGDIKIAPLVLDSTQQSPGFFQFHSGFSFIDLSVFEFESQSPVPVREERSLAEKYLVANDFGERVIDSSTLNCSPEQAHNIIFLSFHTPHSKSAAYEAVDMAHPTIHLTLPLPLEQNHSPPPTLLPPQQASTSAQIVSFQFNVGSKTTVDQGFSSKGTEDTMKNEDDRYGRGIENRIGSRPPSCEHNAPLTEFSPSMAISARRDFCPIIKNILLLDSEGRRVAVKYYTDEWPTNSDKLAFERSIFSKTLKTNARTEAEIVMFENYVVVYKFIQDLHFFVTGGDDENELALATVLQGFFEAVTLLLRGNIDQREALENLDMMFLCLDEIVDGGMILETDGNMIARKVVTNIMDDGAPLSEQTITQALAAAREHLSRSLLR
ncbi:hypothetical protein L1887_19843 [Cichorium endivia]|nr:hypothetical protein L1887_19843 [Cichorium endivia]